MNYQKILLMFSLVLCMLPSVASARIIEKVIGDDFSVIISDNGDDLGTLIFDITYAGPLSRAGFVGRTFLLEMAERTDSVYSKVILAFSGQAKFMLAGNDIRQLSEGYQLGEMAAVHTLMKLPSLVRTPNGEKIYKTWEGAGLAVLAKRTGDFNEMMSRWYLSETVEGFPQTAVENLWSERCELNNMQIMQCYIFQVLKDEKGSPFAEFRISKNSNNQNSIAKLSILAPLETDLSAQVSISDASNNWIKYDFLYCKSDGCLAEGDLSLKNIKELELQRTAKVKIVPFLAPDVEVVGAIDLSHIIESAKLFGIDAPN